MQIQFSRPQIFVVFANLKNFIGVVAWVVGVAYRSYNCENNIPFVLFFVLSTKLLGLVLVKIMMCGQNAI